MRAGRFREDLFYRLNVIEVTLPPLRERRRDILVRWPTGCCGSSPGRRARRSPGSPPEARAAMERHPWPGNLRELRNAVERGVILAVGPEVGLS